MADTTDEEGNPIIAAPTQASAPARMPDAINIQQPQATPGATNAAARINTPTLSAPNVNGGPASFSDVTQSIMGLAQAKTAELSAGMEAYKSNAAVDQATAKSISGITTDTLSALGNIQKIQGLPGGPDGDIAQIVGLFNSDYDYGVQKTRMEINQVKATQITNTAAAIKEQNNALPALLGKVSDAQNVIYQAQTEANKLALQGKTYELDQFKTKIDAARLRLEMNADQRTSADFQVKKMSTAQLEASLAKNPNGPLSGLMEDRLTSEKTALAKMGTAQVEYQKGNRENGNQAMVDAVSHFPIDVSATLLANAKSMHSPVVSIPTGQKGPDGKPGTLDIPYNLFEQGLVQAHGVEQQVNETLAAEQTQKLNLIPNIQNITTSASAFASMDPRGSQVLTGLGNVLKSFDPKNPMSVVQTAKVVQGYSDQMKQIAKDTAAQFTTKEAQGAIENYGNTGKFNSQGGIAVMADSGGVPALAKSSRYDTMWGALNLSVATALKAENFQGVSGGSGGAVNNSTDAMAIIAQAMAKPQGRQNVSQITSKILSDPTKTKPLQDAITAKIQRSSVENVIGQLATQKGADPMWKAIIEHKEDYENPQTGQFDVGKLFDAMEKSTIISHVQGKPVDATQNFLRALRTFSAQPEENTAADPSYTVQDHAAEAALFGGNPAGNILGSLNYQLRAISVQARKTMQDRINKDITGKTQYDAVLRADPLFQPYQGENINDPVFMKKRVGIDINAVPSATGAGVTAAQVKAAYPSGAY